MFAFVADDNHHRGTPCLASHAGSAVDERFAVVPQELFRLAEARRATGGEDDGTDVFHFRTCLRALRGERGSALCGRAKIAADGASRGGIAGVWLKDRTYRGFNFFDPEDEDLFLSLGSGEFNISGFQNKDLRRRLASKNKNTGQVSRLMKRLRTHGLIKKIGRTYKYYLTALGKQVVALGLKLKHLYIIPQLSLVHAD